jgi:hypothetical protein
LYFVQLKISGCLLGFIAYRDKESCRCLCAAFSCTPLVTIPINVGDVLDKGYVTCVSNLRLAVSG